MVFLLTCDKGESLNNIIMSNKGFTAEKPGDETKNESTPTSNTIDLFELEYKKIALGELGHNFAHGIFFDGARLTDFELLDMTGYHYKALGALLERARNGKAFSRLCSFLVDKKAPVVRTIGGVSVPVLAQQLGYNDPSQLFRNMVFGDFLILLNQIRIQNAGKEIAISEKCPNCGTLNEDNPKKGRSFHDLSTVEVNIVEDLKTPLRGHITLNSGLQTGEGEVCKQLVLKPLTVASAEKITVSKDKIDTEDIQLMYELVCEIPGSTWYKGEMSGVFGSELFQSLVPRDISVIRKACTKIMELGAALRIENDCYNCGHEWESALQLGDLKNFLFIDAESSIWL